MSAFPTLTAASGAALALVVLTPGMARAQTVVHELDPRTGMTAQPSDTRLDFLNVGPILSLVGGFAHATGIGVEGSWIEYSSGLLPSLGYGAFAQAQLYDGKYFRGAAGAELAVGPAGGELGLSFRQSDGTYASTLAVHASAFLSIGYLYLAVRASPQLFALPTSEPSFGFETAFTVGLKLPIAIHGRDPSGLAIQAGSPWCPRAGQASC